MIFFLLLLWGAVIAVEIYGFVQLVISDDWLAWVLLVAIVVHIILLIVEIHKAIALSKSLKKFDADFERSNENAE
jgi:hypothetical protein